MNQSFKKRTGQDYKCLAELIEPAHGDDKKSCMTHCSMDIQ